MNSDAPLGRIALLVGAYSPAAIILGFRDYGNTLGWAALIVGALGVIVWVLFLAAVLPKAQPRDVQVREVQAADAQVTGYIASYLLPIIAAKPTHTGDDIAYAICAGLILVVAFVADLGAVNPIVYLFRLRVVTAQVDGRRQIILCKAPPASGQVVQVRRAIGVLYVP